MTVLDPERAMPRSVLRYRPTTDDQARPGQNPVTRPRRHVPDDLEDQREQLPRSRSTPPVHQERSRRRLHPLFFVGFILLLAMLLWIGISQAVSWGNNELNTLKYGNPRTFQIDQVVGQGDSLLHPSHFLAVNLRGTVTIIEFPAGDSSHARILASTTITGPGADQAVAILRFVDVNHNGRPDMLVDIAGIQSVLINDGTTFRTPTPTELQQILQDVQR